jgi:hypothetical protein
VDGDIYVIGGGPDTESGALVQVRVGGTDQAPELSAGWYAQTQGGSATSPSISADGRYVVIADGSSIDQVLDPDAVDARVRVADIEACDANIDEDPDEAVCAFAFEEALERGPMPGSPAILEDGTVIFYEFGLGFSAGQDDRDLVAVGPGGVVWEAVLPDDLDWSSVITVTENHLVGTATRVTASEDQLFALSLPATSEDYVVVLDREDGSWVWQAPIPDDSAATVSVGPNGELYVGMLGIISILSVEERPTLGLVRFSPTEAP